MLATPGVPAACLSLYGSQESALLQQKAAEHLDGDEEDDKEPTGNPKGKLNDQWLRRGPGVL